MKEIINLENVDTTKQPLFFGKDLGMQRYDHAKYEKIDQSFTDQLSFFWRPNEIDVSLDSQQFRELSPNEQRIFTDNLKYQILLDSVQSRAIPFITQRMSNPELEAAAKAWEFFETIHSFSYTYIIKNVYSRPTEVFDEIVNNPEIVKRATSVTKYYNDLICGIDESDIDSAKKKLYLTLVSVNILEGIRFYVSFACSYAFAEQGKMVGNSQIISLINRDENIHLALTQNVLNYLRRNSDEGFQHIVEQCESEVYKMYEDAVNEEIEWAKYLFKDGSMIGLNTDILIEYMKHITGRRMKAIGLKDPYGVVKCPINWIKKHTESDNVQVAPQEREIESYLIGNINNDGQSADLTGFNLDGI